MPIRDADRRLRMLGKIRLGDQVETRSGKSAPHKLTAPRLTSPTRDYLDAAALIYGGEVQAWEGAPGEGDQWELYCTADTLDIVIPPIAQSHSDWYEMWTAGGCQRRCDGFTESLTGNDCMCPPDKDVRRAKAALIRPEACKMTTRLSVLLPKVPDVGVWMVESHGYYAWAEIGGVAEFLAAKAPNAWVPGRLRLDARTAKRKGPNGQPVTHNFVVPVIELPSITAQALGSGAPLVGEVGPGQRSLDRGTGEIGPPPPDVIVPAERRRAFVVAVKDAGYDDDARHALVHFATRGRTASSREVMVSEWPWLQAAFAGLTKGDLLLTFDGDGETVLIERTPFDDERVYDGRQIIAMRCQALGMDRDDKLAYVADIIGREVESTNDLTPAEITMVLESLDRAADRIKAMVNEPSGEAAEHGKVPADAATAGGPESTTESVPPAAWPQGPVGAGHPNRPLPRPFARRSGRPSTGGSSSAPVGEGLRGDQRGGPVGRGREGRRAHHPRPARRLRPGRPPCRLRRRLGPGEGQGMTTPRAPWVREAIEQTAATIIALAPLVAEGNEHARAWVGALVQASKSPGDQRDTLKRLDSELVTRIASLQRLWALLVEAGLVDEVGHEVGQETKGGPRGRPGDQGMTRLPIVCRLLASGGVLSIDRPPIRIPSPSGRRGRTPADLSGASSVHVQGVVHPGGERHKGWAAIEQLCRSGWHTAAVDDRLPRGCGGGRVDAGASDGDDVKLVYRRALKAAHPDHGGDRETLEQVHEAGRKSGVA